MTQASSYWRQLRSRLPWLTLRAAVTLIYVFMLTPIVITAAVSFNRGNVSEFPPEGWSLEWWRAALSAQWLEPIAFSLRLATVASIIATVLGLVLALVLHRFRFAGRDALVTLTMAPLMLPALVTGIGLLQFFHFTGLRDWIGMPSLIVGHVAISIPYAVRTISISLAAIPANLELAAMNLGADHLSVLRSITLPMAKSGVFAGVVFTFIHSFNDVPLSLFISRPGAEPIPIVILNFMEFGFAPTLAAVATLTVVIPLILVIAVERVVGIGDFVFGRP